ncbi:hypothetical protein [Pseudomonas aeruginosa]|uniref:hypothetical protein n=1 Tax=Pseudomonas aeruginosa TaxID=287 RepID=UPI0003BAF198|nr:hypothetical protein [Pseudomonas aeruginosa]ERY96113.1 hypothetical protein Q022_04397 [Pseudomonas aeruginosa BWHPSA009]
MTLPPSPFDQGRRGRWLKIAVSAWLLLVSVITVINSVGLSRLTEQTRRGEEAAQFKALSARVTDLAQQIDAGRRQPKPATQADFLKVRRALDERLAHTEQAQAGLARASDVQALAARVAAIEEHQQQAHSLSATPTVRRRVTTKPKMLEPPFRVVGMDVRGGERFLSIAAPAAASPANVRLLREGDTDSGWQLQSIDAHAALFLVNGKTQRVALP